jgi:UDP-N-acetylglucosamine 2-epimerase
MRLLAVLGTRPEAIKLAPVIRALRTRDAQVLVCASGQHRELLDPLLQFFGVRPDYDLDVMREQHSREARGERCSLESQGERSSLEMPGERSSLAGMMARVMAGVADVIVQSQPDVVLVHGDTATALASSLAAFMQRTPIAHVEAGLRSGDLHSPWPEEANRRLTDALSHWYFAPTAGAKRNLLHEGVAEEKVFVTGNTVIDSLNLVVARLQSDQALRASLEQRFAYLDATPRMILVTGHRRENFGENFRGVCAALKSIASAHPDVSIVYPVHLNPNVQGPAHALLGAVANIHLIAPQEYVHFVYLMYRSYLIVTDSGGVQEEAPALGKPVLVTRACTERPEAIKVGAARLVGSDPTLITAAIERLLGDRRAYDYMAKPRTLYGDGQAGARIAQILLQGAPASVEVKQRSALRLPQAMP